MNSLLSSLRVEQRGGGSGGGGGGGSKRSTNKGQAGAPLQYDPIAAADPAVAKERCRSTRGDWCGRYLAQEPIPAKPPPQGNQTCLWKCNSVGTCDAMKGWCRCPAGWMGDDCSTRMKVCAAARQPTTVAGKHHVNVRRALRTSNFNSTPIASPSACSAHAASAFAQRASSPTTCPPMSARGAPLWHVQTIAMKTSVGGVRQQEAGAGHCALLLFLEKGCIKSPCMPA